MRKKAAKRKLSLNQIVVEELAAATTGLRRRANVDDVGKWTPDPAFDEIIAAQRQIDPDKWK